MFKRKPHATDSQAIRRWDWKWWIGVIGIPIVVVIIGAILGWMTPEGRRWLGLDKPKPAVVPSATTDGASHPIPATQGTEPSQAPAKPDQSKTTKTHRATQKTTTHVTGKDNVAGNNISGDNNVTGNNNQSTPIAVAPNGIAITGGTVSNPTVNNAPPPLVMSQGQQDHLTSSVQPFVSQFKGKKINISLHNATTETAEFGSRMDAAFRAAGFQTNTGGVTFIGAVLSRGVTIRFGTNQTKLAEAVRDSLLRDKIVDKVYSSAGLDADDFLIIVAP